jgi:uncharacterized membrane-anchored protein YjiN (DUF445 family)
MSDEVKDCILTIEKDIALTSLLASLDNTQNALLKKVISLIEETPESLQLLSETTRSRRKAAKRLFKAIFQMNRSLFLLCVLKLSITKLGSIKKPQSLIQALKEWWKEDKVSPVFHKLAARLIEANRKIFIQSGKQLLHTLNNHSNHS